MPTQSGARGLISGHPPPRRAALVTLATLAAFIRLGCVSLAHAYLDGPPAAHTGGFGEPTCAACHFDGALSPGGRSLAVSGLPATYSARQSYVFTLRLSDPKMTVGGFQLAVRFASGEARGHQAGTLTATDGHSRVVTEPDTGIQYAQHAISEGAAGGGGEASWTMRWDAPPCSDAPVVFHFVANGANGDASEFGDSIYISERRISCQQAGGP